MALRPRVRAEDEDRYLFAVALSRAKTRLWLSWRLADDEGGATARSPFVDEVRELLDPPLQDDLALRDEQLAAEAGGRGIAESVFAPGSAPSEDELARALASRVGAVATGSEPGLDCTGDELRARVAAASRRPRRRRRRAPRARSHVAAGRARRDGRQVPVRPIDLEEFATCPYRWFVQHESSTPKEIEPESDALTSGQVAHRVLEALYRERPGGQARPTPATLELWRSRAIELIDEMERASHGDSAIGKEDSAGHHRYLRWNSGDASVSPAFDAAFTFEPGKRFAASALAKFMRPSIQRYWPLVAVSS